MRTFTPLAGTRFYAGVDLHARALFLVILDGDGQVRFARNLPANPDAATSSRRVRRRWGSIPTAPSPATRLTSTLRAST
jgi:hypothetical protein